MMLYSKKIKGKMGMYMVACLLLFTGFSNLYAQPGLALGNVEVCNDTTVLIPLTGTNLNNIGAITLFILYNENAMSFHSVQDADPQLSGMMINSLSSPPRVAIVWSKVSGASFPNTTLMNLKFILHQQAGTLSFIHDSCEIADLSLPPQILNVTLSNGSVFESVPAIASGPDNQTVLSQSNALFQVSALNSSGFKWEESRNQGSSWNPLPESSRYSGTKTNILTIRDVPLSYNNFLYRCILHAHSCDVPSTAAALEVDSLSGTVILPTGQMVGLTIEPNPFSSTTSLEFTVPDRGTVTITILSMTGQLMATPVNDLRPAGTYRLENDLADLPSGIYFCHYVFKGVAGIRDIYKKMIKFN